MSCKGHLYYDGVVELYTECIYPDTLNILAPTKIHNGVMSWNDEEWSLISIEIGSEAYEKLKSYFMRGIINSGE